ncbi:MAG TPA: multicopper oxidase family protein, partial [Myxococcota bacterium]|nr:multicopper oxidase family protein [Myxococcota bacterium]
RVPEAMDGIAQMDDPIEPGESFTYEYVVKDAGFYWYHPHMETAETIEAGLIGVIVARAPDEVAPACEVPLALDDILLDREGQIEPPGTDMDQVMGRLGDTLLVNGRADRVIEVPAGGQVVLRMVATSNARHFDLGFEGLGLQLLGTDGGYLPDARALDRVRLAPGERAIVSFQAPADPGAELVLMNRRVQLHEEDADETAMHEIDPMGDEDHAILRFVTIDADPGAPWVAPAFDPPVAVTEGAPAHTWVLEEDMMAGVLTIDGAEWPDVPMVMFDGGAPTTLVIDNRSEMRHPFHTHGNRYIVTSIGGATVADRAWKDTFDVPPRTAVTVVSELDNPGMWMYHCHILEHADRGMAGMMVVR